MEQTYSKRQAARDIFRLAWPTVMEQILTTAVSYVDTAMVGHIGPDASAAVGVTMTVNWLINGTVSALGIRMPNPAAATGNVTDAVSDELVLHMADGSQYVVESEKDNIMNWVVGLCIADKDYHIIGSAYSFNRMVDVDAVTSVTFGGHYYTDLTAETATTFNYTYTR